MESERHVVDPCADEPEPENDHPAAAPKDPKQTEDRAPHSTRDELRPDDSPPSLGSRAAPHVECSQAPHIHHGARTLTDWPQLRFTARVVPARAASSGSLATTWHT